MTIPITVAQGGGGGEIKKNWDKNIASISRRIGFNLLLTSLI